MEKEYYEKSTFEYDGSCPGREEYPECIPLKNTTFGIWNEKDGEKNLKNLNEYIEQKYNFKKKIRFERESINGTERIIARFTEKGEEGDSFVLFMKSEEMITSKSLTISDFMDFELGEKMEQLKNIDLHTEMRNLIFVMLIHLYHANNSKFGPDLMFLPSPEKLQIPSITMTPFELSLLKIDQVYNISLRERAKILEGYNDLLAELDSWDPATTLSFLGRKQVPLQDYAYAYAVVQRAHYSTYIKSKNNSVAHYIPPVLHHLPLAPSIGFNSKMRFDYLETDGNEPYSFRITLGGNFKENDELFNDFVQFRTENLFLTSGHIPKLNYFDCTTFEILDSQTLKMMGLEKSNAFSILFSFSLSSKLLYKDFALFVQLFLCRIGAFDVR